MAELQCYNKKFLSKIRPDPGYQKHIISFSQYSKYFKCPHSWKLRYIDQISFKTESIDLVFGQAIHTTIQHWLTLLYTKTIKAAVEFDYKTFLLNEIKTEYAERVKKYGKHFSTPEQLSEYYLDGIEIISFLIKKRSSYFSKKKIELIAIELPILESIIDSYNVLFKGFVDIILYDSDLKKYYILDLKTSKKGWGDYKKKDTLTTDQLILYKMYVSKQYNIPLDSIDINYLILKRKIDQNSLWPQKRIQEFSPSAGSVSLNRVRKNIEKYITECFNADGTFNVERSYPAISGVGQNNCMFCEYNNEDLCPSAKRISYEH